VTARADRRDALIGRVADALLAQGLAAATLRPLARAAGTSDRMLLYYFPDKDSLLAAAAARLSDRLMAMLDAVPLAPLPPDDLARTLGQAARDPAYWPYLALWLDMAARAARGDALWRGIGHDVGLRILHWTAARLDLPPGPARDRAALDVLAHVEGGIVISAVGLGPATG
jgi:AcrR family transcriptional regulator